ncbi:MAG TPA: cation:proton antiporter [Deferribacteraceae bacterium]|jgi:multicomponent Na+:H+ antiporter subunit F|nr:cation:proton antiporter [Deferribacteraceae bacterium]
MFSIAATILIISAVITIIRMLKGPTVFDRILAANLIGTKTVILILLLGYIYGRPHFSDLALVYALINFIVTIALLRYMEKGRLD